MRVESVTASDRFDGTDLSNEFDDARAFAEGVGDLRYLDWCCVDCGLGARAYVLHWAGGRFGDYGARIAHLFEVWA